MFAIGYKENRQVQLRFPLLPPTMGCGESSDQVAVAQELHCLGSEALQQPWSPAVSTGTGGAPDEIASIFEQQSIPYFAWPEGFCSFLKFWRIRGPVESTRLKCSFHHK